MSCPVKGTLNQHCITLQQDQFERRLPTFIQVIELTEWEEAEYWSVVSAVFEGKRITPVFDSNSEKPTTALKSSLLDTGINNKVYLHGQ